MTDQAAGVKIGDRVQSGARTGVVEFVVSDVILVKWDGRRDPDAYTRDAFERQFTAYNPKAEVTTAAAAAAAAAPARPGSFLIPQLPSAPPL
jgi:hypothetical protein